VTKHEPAPDEPATRAGRPWGVRPSRSPGDQARRRPLWQEAVFLLALAIVLAMALKTFVVQAFYIPSGSMNDTLVLNDRIIVEKVTSWGGADPSRGDVVVFSDPGGWLGDAPPGPTSVLTRGLEAVGLFPTGGHLVKRVIGVGGDRVRCCDDEGRVTVNGTPLEEPYLAPGDAPSDEPFDVRVPDGSVWVMGDHRSASADSRAHLGEPGGGMVPLDDVVGRVVAVVWPARHATVLHRPGTFDAVASARAR
jgi:signal peptidase I